MGARRYVMWSSFPSRAGAVSAHQAEDHNEREPEWRAGAHEGHTERDADPQADRHRDRLHVTPHRHAVLLARHAIGTDATRLLSPRI